MNLSPGGAAQRGYSKPRQRMPHGSLRFGTIGLPWINLAKFSSFKGWPQRQGLEMSLNRNPRQLGHRPQHSQYGIWQVGQSWTFSPRFSPQPKHLPQAGQTCRRTLTTVKQPGQEMNSPILCRPFGAFGRHLIGTPRLRVGLKADAAPRLRQDALEITFLLFLLHRAALVVVNEPTLTF
jgi:hypothetical protein